MNRYEPRLDSLRAHPVPDWFHDAKLGIFVHWGLYSVPAWAPRSGTVVELARTRVHDMNVVLPYAEWYWNSLKFPHGPTAAHHTATFGDGVDYTDFRRDFLAGVERWDPDEWAELFRAAGARYVVLVTKHHDGFLLWPSRTPNPHRRDWQTRRDVVGELARAVRARGLHFGVYYSGGLDWTFEPRPIASPGGMFAALPRGGAYLDYVDAHVRELVERVRPSVLWNDIGYPGRRGWPELVADYYNAVPDGAINDRWLPGGWWNFALRNGLVRWGFDAAVGWFLRRGGAYASLRPAHCDFQTPEYTRFPEARSTKWESTRGIGHSFGYNRNETPEDRIGQAELIRDFADTVAKNGNLLLNVGPTAEGRIPPEQTERLEQLGAWLGRCGDAVYGTRPWTRAEGETADPTPLSVRYTAREGTVYAILLGTPAGRTFALREFPRAPRGPVRVVGGDDARFRARGGDLEIELAAPLPEAPAHALAIRI